MMHLKRRCSLVIFACLVLAGCASMDVLYEGPRKARNDVAVLKHVHHYEKVDCVIDSIDGISKSTGLRKLAKESDWKFDYKIELLPGEHTLVTHPFLSGYAIYGNKHKTTVYNFEAGKTYLIRYNDSRELEIEEEKKK